VVKCALIHYLLQKIISDDWTCDGYRFRQNGISLLPKKTPALKKTHYLIFLPEGRRGSFKKFVYQLLHDSKFLVIHYTGNEQDAIDFPHGLYSAICVFCTMFTYDCPLASLFFCFFIFFFSRTHTCHLSLCHLLTTTLHNWIAV
jgi:hypothetical protein